MVRLVSDNLTQLHRQNCTGIAFVILESSLHLAVLAPLYNILYAQYSIIICIADIVCGNMSNGLFKTTILKLFLAAEQNFFFCGTLIQLKINKLIGSNYKLH